MHQLSQSNEDYLKNIWLLGEKTGQTAGVRALAKRMSLSPSTVSEAMKKLTEQGYVEHHRYSGIKLTATGEKIALQMTRKHRLLETYLVAELGYTWDEVHAEAEALEHVVSAQFISRIDHILGYPTVDPHGDPIPSADGKINLPDIKLLSEISTPGIVEIARVSDDDSEVLAFLGNVNLVPGIKCEIKAISPALGTITAVPENKNEIQITFPIANRIWVINR